MLPADTKLIVENVSSPTESPVPDGPAAPDGPASDEAAAAEGGPIADAVSANGTTTSLDAAGDAAVASCTTRAPLPTTAGTCNVTPSSSARCCGERMVLPL